MIRPELIVLARRWRESLTGTGLAALGLWAGVAATGLLSVLGWIALAAGLALAEDRSFAHVPPMDVLFVQRKFAGMFLLAARLGARVDVRAIVARYV